MTEKKITTLQKVHVKINPSDSNQNPAAIDGPVTFEVTQGDATVEPDEDGKGAFLVSGSAMENKIKVSADADLGSGVETISDEISLVVENPKATSLGMSFDEPVNK